MDGLIGDVSRLTLVAVAALFPIVNPVGNAPIFLGLTRRATPEVRRLLARRIAVNGFVLLVVAMLLGTYILAFFGITAPAVQVGGGLVLAATGWTLLHQRTADGSGEERVGHGPDLLSQSFYPLTLPVTVGPGSLSVAITLGATSSRPASGELTFMIAALLSAAGIALAIYLSYRSSEHVERWLGESAMSVFLRLSAFLLLCLGVQILWSGVSAFWRTLPR